MASKRYPDQIYCPVFKHKIHCSRIEDTEVSELPEERKFEFCLTKCPIFKKHKDVNKETD